MAADKHNQNRYVEYRKKRTEQTKIILELDKLNMDIIVQSETNKKGGGEMLGNYMHIRSGVLKA